MKVVGSLSEVLKLGTIITVNITKNNLVLLCNPVLLQLQRPLSKSRQHCN